MTDCWELLDFKITFIYVVSPSFSKNMSFIFILVYLYNSWATAKEKLYFAATDFESSRPEVFCKKIVACIFINKETLAQLFSCEFCEIYRNTVSYRTPLLASSADCWWKIKIHSTYEKIRRQLYRKIVYIIINEIIVRNLFVLFSSWLVYINDHVHFLDFQFIFLWLFIFRNIHINFLWWRQESILTAKSFFQFIRFSLHCVKSAKIWSCSWSQYKKTPTRKNSVFGQFSRSAWS